MKKGLHISMETFGFIEHITLLFKHPGIYRACPIYQLFRLEP